MVDEPEPEPEPEERKPTLDDPAAVDMKDNDTLYWVYWPSLLNPGMQFMIGWPMRLQPREPKRD